MSEEISNVHILALQEQIRKNLAFRDNLLREKSVDDLWVFNRYILDVERGKKPLGEFQKQLCRFIEEEKTVKKLGLLPRGHLKTTLATIGYSTQQIVKNQNIRILLLNGTWQLAVDSLAEVKRHLQSNPNILRIWGDLTVGNSEWSQDRITLARSNTNIKGPTVWAAGIESNLIGSHPDIIIMDDVVTRENTETIEQIDKVKLRYKDALDLLEPGGQLIIIGTRYTYNDFYSWIIEKNEKHNNFRMMIKRAFIGDMHTGQDFQALWPEKFSREELLERLQEKGPYEFFCTPSETPILMGDYTEKRISRVKPGDEIIGFTTGASERHRLVKTKVTRRMYYPNVEIYQIKLKSGRFVRCTLDHKWYSGRGSLDKTHPMYYKPKIGRTLGFVAPIDDIMPTQKELRAWNYLAGIFDGEGSAKSGGCLTISQGNGNMPVYKKIIEILQYLKIDYSESERLPDYANGRNNQGGKLIWLRDNFETQLKLIRYTELAKKQQLIDRLLEKGRRFIREEDVIVSIELLRKDNVYALETETGNYIAWGYASSNSQYCNEPTSAEDADFKREWFKYYDPEEYRGAKMNTVMTIDPAISEKKSADYTAIGVFAADQWQNHFVKDLYRGHWKVDKIVEAIFYVYALHHPQAIILETIAYQKALAYILQLEMQKRGIYLPIIEKQYHDRSKDERIRALQPLYAAGKVFHQKAISLTRNFEEELLQFPRGAHDDLIDTFAMSLDYLVPPTRHHAKRYQQKYLY